MGLILWIHVPGTRIPQPSHFFCMFPNSANSPKPMSTHTQPRCKLYVTS